MWASQPRVGIVEFEAESDKMWVHENKDYFVRTKKNIILFGIVVFFRVSAIDWSKENLISFNIYFVIIVSVSGSGKSQDLQLPKGRKVCFSEFGVAILISENFVFSSQKPVK